MQQYHHTPSKTKPIPQSWILNTVGLIALLICFAAYNYKRDTARPPDRVVVGSFGGVPTGIILYDKKNRQLNEFAYSIPSSFRNEKEVKDWFRTVFHFKGKLAVEKDSTGNNFIISYATP